VPAPLLYSADRDVGPGAVAREPTETRPWGCFYVLEEGVGFKVKRIVVNPKGRLSLQSHKHRSEHWTVIAGEATVTVGNLSKIMTRGQAIDIALGDRHRIENFGSTDVEVIEVQFGDYLGEDDIIRYEDAYGRV
jgi:mannose-1-phosphate guanylyltransferase/mannose-1-phosphate guanylyltransferase/mannose-6-phosphate isomerase